MALGDSAGLKATQEAHKAVDDALAQVKDALIPAMRQAMDEVLTQAAGSLERSVGAMCLALGSTPEQIMMALDGLEVTISPVTIKVSRRQST